MDTEQQQTDKTVLCGCRHLLVLFFQNRIGWDTTLDSEGTDSNDPKQPMQQDIDYRAN